jgi:hypothetical protein
MSSPPAPRIFHGWIVVGAAFAVMFAGFGVGYSFGAFFTELEREFQARRGDLSIVFAISGALYFGLGLPSGAAADRWGPRRVALLGMVIMTAGWRWPAAPMRCGGSTSRPASASASASASPTSRRWARCSPGFQRRRAFASGIAIAGIGARHAGHPAAHRGWSRARLARASYLVLAAGTLLVGGGGALLLDSRPQRRGLGPDGQPVAREAGPRAVTGVDFRTAVRSRPFRLMAFAAFLTSFGIFTPYVHLAPHAIDLGATPAMAAALLGVIGAGSILGRFVIARPPTASAAGGMVAVVPAQAVLLFLGLADRYWMLALFAGAWRQLWRLCRAGADAVRGLLRRPRHRRGHGCGLQRRLDRCLRGRRSPASPSAPPATPGRSAAALLTALAAAAASACPTPADAGGIGRLSPTHQPSARIAMSSDCSSPSANSAAGGGHGRPGPRVGVPRWSSTSARWSSP